jgi:hypothetical protein
MTAPLKYVWSTRWFRVVAGAVEDAAEDHPFTVAGLLCVVFSLLLAFGIPLGVHFTALGLERALLSTQTCVGIALLAIGILCSDLFCHASEIVFSDAEQH